jgi:beta-lactamase regulating signal transducer with metallopeptidase domain
MEDNFCLNSTLATAKAAGRTKKLIKIQPNFTEHQLQQPFTFILFTFLIVIPTDISNAMFLR